MTVGRYIAHAKKYGVDGGWQTASCELAPPELVKLAGELAAVAKQRREPSKLSPAWSVAAACMVRCCAYGVRKGCV